MSFINQKGRKTVDDKSYFNLDKQDISLNLGEAKLVFQDGSWIMEEKQNIDEKLSEPVQSVTDLKAEVLKLQEENNYLHLRNEVMMTMVAEGECKRENIESVLLKLKEENNYLKSEVILMLTEENNYLKLKNEIILTMLAERECKLKIPESVTKD